jgi:hypothetical protein
MKGIMSEWLIRLLIIELVSIREEQYNLIQTWFKAWKKEITK